MIDKDKINEDRVDNRCNDIKRTCPFFFILQKPIRAYYLIFKAQKVFKF